MLARRRLPERRLPLERTEVAAPPPPPPAPTASPLRAFRFCRKRSGDKAVWYEVREPHCKTEAVRRRT